MKHGTTLHFARSATKKQKSTRAALSSSYGKLQRSSNSMGSLSTKEIPKMLQNFQHFSTVETCRILRISRTTLYAAKRKLNLKPVPEKFTIYVTRQHWPMRELKRLADEEKRPRKREEMVTVLEKLEQEWKTCRV